MKISLATPIQAIVRRAAAPAQPEVDDQDQTLRDWGDKDAATLAAPFFCGLASGNYV